MQCLKCREKFQSSLINEQLGVLLQLPSSVNFVGRNKDVVEFSQMNLVKISVTNK